MLTLAPSAASLAQTRVVPPANSYTPAQDVELGRRGRRGDAKDVAADARRQASPRSSQDIGAPAGGRHSSRSAAFRISMYVRSRERRRDQRLRAARRSDVRQPRHDRGGAHRRRSRGRDGARVEPRRPSSSGQRRPARPRNSASGRSPAPCSAPSSAAAGVKWCRRARSSGIGTMFLRFSREFERQADHRGRRRSWPRAGYDPNDMANMLQDDSEAGWFGRTCSGSATIRIRATAPTTFPARRRRYRSRTRFAQRAEFQQLQAHLKQLPPAPTTEQATRNAERPGRTGDSGRRRLPSGRVDPPSSSFQTYTEGSVFRISVPSNWRELPGGSAGDVCARRRLRRRQRAERLHARRGSRVVAQRNRTICRRPPTS